ncbi:hypothetical protein A7K94_0221760, partial [Modestobacter sp. VKM Ac-2676]
MPLPEGVGQVAQWSGPAASSASVSSAANNVVVIAIGDCRWVRTTSCTSRSPNTGSHRNEAAAARCGSTWAHTSRSSPSVSSHGPA